MTAFITPYDRGDAKKVGTRAFRKRVLPVGSIDYEGQKVTFDQPFLQTLVDSFHSAAFDQVPFQLATADNKHNNDPERTRGEVTALDLQPDGLYATVAVTDEGARILSENPKLGISARIVNALTRPDGANFKAAMQHVLGTLDPKLTGLGPWQAIEAANNRSGEKVFDLTSLEFTEEPVAPPQLTEEELEQLRAIIAAGGSQGTAGDSDPADDDDDNDDGDELTDEELNELIAAAEEFDAGDELGDEELIAAANDPAVQNALLFTRSVQESQAIELARVTEQLDTQRWESEKLLFAREYGIPVPILDEAEPLLKGDGHVIELSNGQAIDAGAVMRRVLTAIGQTVKMLDLSAELGSSYEEPAQQQEATERATLVSNFRSLTGI